MLNPIYFPSLNAIRAYASLSVVVIHVYTLSRTLNFGPSFRSPLEVLVLPGADSVTLFFVLSGFLISYLLLVERQQTDTIAVRKFYMRRLLRVWPLYYATIFLGGVVFPFIYGMAYPLPENIPAVWGLILLFMANIPYLFFTYMPMFLSHLWSVSVEEQFYLVWPVLLRRFKLQHVAVTVIIVETIIAVGLWVLEASGLDIKWLREMLNLMRFKCMAIGALGAYVVFTRHSILNLLYRPITQWTAWTFIAFVVVGPEIRGISPIYDIILSTIFITVIINVATNPQSVIKLENRAADWLGKISYSTYMLHPLVTFSTLYAFRAWGLPLAGLHVDAAIICGTIIVAAISYYGFERHFLQAKNRFVVVPSKMSAYSALEQISTTGFALTEASKRLIAKGFSALQLRGGLYR